MNDLYETIREECEKQGKSVSRMCLDIGISKSTMSSLKNGISKSLTVPTLQKIAAYLGVSADYLLGKEEKPSADDDEELWEIRQAMKDRAELKTLFHLSKNATPAEVRKMLKVLQLIKEDDENVD